MIGRNLTEGASYDKMVSTGCSCLRVHENPVSNVSFCSNIICQDYGILNKKLM